MQTHHDNFVPGAEDDLQGMGTAVYSALQAARSALRISSGGGDVASNAIDEIDAVLGQGPALFSRYPGVPNSRRGAPNQIKLQLPDELFMEAQKLAFAAGYQCIAHFARDLLCIELHGKKYMELEADKVEISRARRLETAHSMADKAGGAS